MAKQAVTILGVKELERKLEFLARSVSKRAVNAGMKEGMKPLVKGFREAINATTLPNAKNPPVGQSQAQAHQHIKREARRSIGARFTKRRRETERGAKVGFKVSQFGKKGATNVTRGKAAKHGPKGVGASVRNIYWFGKGKGGVGSGAKDRVTKGGLATGSMPVMFKNIRQQVMARKGSESFQAQKRAVTKVIHREARKRA